MKLTIFNFKCPSLNASYAGRHWSKRKAEADEIHELVFIEVLKNKLKPIKKFPVDIKVEAFYKDKRRRDSCNVSSKEIIDGLVIAKIIPDDSTKYLRWVFSRANIGEDEDKVEVTIDTDLKL